jgi:hypothetical protein
MQLRVCTVQPIYAFALPIGYAYAYENDRFGLQISADKCEEWESSQNERVRGVVDHPK